MTQRILSIIILHKDDFLGFSTTISSVVSNLHHILSSCDRYNASIEILIFDASDKLAQHPSFQLLIEKVNSVSSIKVELYSNVNSGIWGSFNFATTEASGHYLLALNSGDSFFKVTSIHWDMIFSHLLTSNFQIIPCFCRICDSIGYFFGYHPSSFKDDISRLFKLTSFNHQATFIRRDFLLRNPFNVNKSLGEDSRIIRLGSSHSNYLILPIVLSIHLTGGMSSPDEPPSFFRLLSLLNPRNFNFNLIRRYILALILCSFGSKELFRFYRRLRLSPTQSVSRYLNL